MSTSPKKEISDWLEKLGLPEYADRFAENEIDVRVPRTRLMARCCATLHARIASPKR